MKKKACSRCKRSKLLTQFGRRAAMRDGHRSECKVCLRKDGALRRSRDPEHAKQIGRRFYERHQERMVAAARTYRERNPAKHVASVEHSRLVTRWYNGLAQICKGTAKRKGLEFDLDGAFILELFERQGGCCYWFGIPLVPSTAFRDPRRPSVDRLDKRRGYTRKNVVLSCMFANMGRSAVDTKAFAAFVVELRAAMRA